MKDSKGRFLHDFSYAGYHRGEQAIPATPQGAVYNVTQPPYSADATGKQDATLAIQKAIDAAGAAGGGIVYLPAGTYRVEPQPVLDDKGRKQFETIDVTLPSKGTKDYIITAEAALRIAQNGVVIRGAGIGKTFVLSTAANMHNKNIFYFSAEGEYNSWHTEIPGTVILAANDIPYPTHQIALKSVKGLKVGDDIMLRQDATDAWADDFGFRVWSEVIPDGIAFAREITAIDNKRKTITIDIPTRYTLKTRDNARLFKVGPQVEESGLEDLSIGMLKNTSPSTPKKLNDDCRVPGTMGWEVHGSYMVHFKHAKNCWMQRVASYEPPNNGGIHINSNAVYLRDCNLITVRNCSFEKAQYRGNGGNGYGISPRGNDCLIQDVSIKDARHCYSFRHVSCSGNVLLRCLAGKSRLASDFHQRLSMANLWDSATVEDGNWIAATYRKSGSKGAAGHTTTETVIWNTQGNGGGTDSRGGNWHHDGESLVVSSQWGWGYVIGTKGAQYKVCLDLDPETQDALLAAGNAASEAPRDFMEGEGEGATLEPQSLYEDQLKRRLGAKHY